MNNTIRVLNIRTGLTVGRCLSSEARSCLTYDLVHSTVLAEDEPKAMLVLKIFSDCHHGSRRQSYVRSDRKRNHKR